MRTLLRFSFLLLALSGCASFNKARRLAKAERVLADYQRDTPPEDQLSNLVARHPELEGKTLRIVKETDTIRVPGSTITVTVPAASTPATDNALVDSLMHSVATQLHAKDSLAYAARLRAILASRPRFSRDTTVQVFGATTVRTWLDAKGQRKISVTNAPQNLAYQKEIHQTGPVLVKRELAIWERVWLWVKNAAGLIIAALVCIGGIWLWFFIQRQRKQAPTQEGK